MDYVKGQNFSQSAIAISHPNAIGEWWWYSVSPLSAFMPVYSLNLHLWTRTKGLFPEPAQCPKGHLVHKFTCAKCIREILVFFLEMGSFQISVKYPFDW